MLEESVDSTYDRISEEYAERYPEPSKHTEDFAELLGGGKVLDAGCGPGSDSGFLFSQGFDVVGVDLSKGMIETARRRFPGVEFRRNDLRELDFPENEFDGIIANMSLNHLERDDMEGVLDDFSYFLKPGGILYCGFQEGEPEEGYFSNLLEDDREVFLTIVSEEGIKEVLRDRGFEIEFAEKYEPAEDEVQFRKLHIIARGV